MLLRTMLARAGRRPTITSVMVMVVVVFVCGCGCGVHGRAGQGGTRTKYVPRATFLTPLEELSIYRQTCILTPR